MRKPLTTLLVGVQALGILGLTTTGMLSLPMPAQALCAANPMDGVWQNVNPNTRSLVKVEYALVAMMWFCALMVTVNHSLRMSAESDFMVLVILQLVIGAGHRFTSAPSG